jgi:Sugar-specific transcriptional regulator TrmB
MYTTAAPRVELPSRWITMPMSTGGPPPTPVDTNPDLAAGLKLVGMPHRQARLYLALSRGPQTARHASEIARVHRATAYRLLVRLLHRGLIVGDGRNPQTFQAVPADRLLRRLEGFLREEADLCAALTGAYARWASVAPARPDRSSMVEPPRVLTRTEPGRHPLLAEIGTARQTLDVVVRPSGCSATLRAGILRALGGLQRRGVKIRLITDATPPDQRFVSSLLRDARGAPPHLQLRHLAPLGAHYYVCDSRVAVRLPGLGSSPHLPDIAIIERDPGRVRTQAQRFEALWAEGSEPFGPNPSTRSYAWSRAATLLGNETRPYAMAFSSPPATASRNENALPLIPAA